MYFSTADDNYHHEIPSVPETSSTDTVDKVPQVNFGGGTESETMNVQHAIELFSEVLAALGPDENIYNNEIIHELYEEMSNLRFKLKIMAANHKEDSKSLDGLLQLYSKIEDISAKYLSRMNQPFQQSSSHLTLLKKHSSDKLTESYQQTSLQLASIGVSTDPYDEEHAEIFRTDSLLSSSSSESESDDDHKLKTRNREKRVRSKKLPNCWSSETKMIELLGSEANTTLSSHPFDLIDLTTRGSEIVPAVSTTTTPTTTTTASTGFKAGYIVPQGPGSCPICCEDEVPAEDLYIFSQCEHQYCKECLQGYYSTKINENKITDISCPNPTCSTIVEYHQVQDIVTPELFAKYDEYAFLASLSADPMVKWCPRPGCGNAMIGDPENPRLECTNSGCRFEFCFLCNEQWHPNVTCEQFQEWRVDNGLVDLKFVQWSKKNTKKCPQCKTLIEKMSGCNHMTCSACKYQFCWLCGGKYSGNHFDVFNVFGCPGMQSGSKKFGMAKRVGMRALIGTGLVLGGVVGVALAIPAVVVAGPIWGGIKIHQKRKASHRRKRYHF